MADQPFNRTPLYPLEKPLADDINQGFSQADRSLRDFLYQFYSQANGFVQASLKVGAAGPPSLNVVMAAGIAFYDNGTDVPTAIGGVVGLDDRARYKPIVLGNPLTIAVPAPPGANSRIDLIEVAYNRLSDNPQSREFLDPTTDAFAPALKSKTLDFNVDGTLAYYAAAAVPTTALAYKSGVAGVSPVAPTTDTGYMAVATILVVSGAVVINTGDITDQRSLLGQDIESGTLIAQQKFTANGTYTPTALTKKVRVRMCGGGGAGAAAQGGAVNSGAASGGASGTTIEVTLISGSLITGGAITIGAAGAPAAYPAAGGTGGDTVAVINATTYTAKGGLGGHAGNRLVPPSVARPGLPQAGSTAGDYVTADPGQMGINNGNAGSDQFVGGSGGSGGMGIGGDGAVVSGVGGAGAGFGAGGGGAVTSGGDAEKAGGAGTAGIVIIQEYT